MKQHMPQYPNGYYDEDGQWHRTKFCFVYCGTRCNCQPPYNQYYNPEFDKKLEEQKQDNDKTLSST